MIKQCSEYFQINALFCAHVTIIYPKQHYSVLHVQKLGTASFNLEQVISKLTSVDLHQSLMFSGKLWQWPSLNPSNKILIRFGKSYLDDCKFLIADLSKNKVHLCFIKDLHMIQKLILTVESS